MPAVVPAAKPHASKPILRDSPMPPTLDHDAKVFWTRHDLLGKTTTGQGALASLLKPELLRAR
jgi:hypothetical protein